MAKNEIIKPVSGAVDSASRLTDDAKRYVRASISPNTERAYKAQWRKWAEWCTERGLDPFSGNVDDVANWISERAAAGLSISTIKTSVAAVKFGYGLKELLFDTSAPKIKAVLAGINREEARAPKQAQAIRADDAIEVITVGPDADLIEIRDAATIALGYLFALRRSELVSLDYRKQGEGGGFIVIGTRSVDMTLVKSKTSGGKPQTVSIPIEGNEDAVQIIERWIAAAGIREGQPLIRRVRKGSNVGGRATDQTVASIVKRRIGQNYSGHSLRVGFAVSAAEAGADLRSIAAVTRHRSMEMPRRYAEQAEQLRTSPYNSPGVGLNRRSLRRGAEIEGAAA